MLPCLLLWPARLSARPPGPAGLSAYLPVCLLCLPARPSWCPSPPDLPGCLPSIWNFPMLDVLVILLACTCSLKHLLRGSRSSCTKSAWSDALYILNRGSQHNMFFTSFLQAAKTFQLLMRRIWHKWMGLEHAEETGFPIIPLVEFFFWHPLLSNPFKWAEHTVVKCNLSRANGDAKDIPRFSSIQKSTSYLGINAMVVLVWTFPVRRPNKSGILHIILCCIFL